MPNGKAVQGKGKLWWRHWSVVFILAVLAGLVIWSMLNLGPWLKSWQEKRAALAAQRLLEKQYREDTYGGKTPEETFDMFIAALEKGDTELASKYFVLNKQEQWKKTLEEYKTGALLSDFVGELKNTAEKWQKTSSSDENSVSFEYKVKIENESAANFNGKRVTIPAGNYTNETIFQKYPADIWKISVL